MKIEASAAVASSSVISGLSLSPPIVVTGLSENPTDTTSSFPDLLISHKAWASSQSARPSNTRKYALGFIPLFMTTFDSQRIQEVFRSYIACVICLPVLRMPLVSRIVLETARRIIVILQPVIRQRQHRL